MRCIDEYYSKHYLSPHLSHPPPLTPPYPHYHPSLKHRYVCSNLGVALEVVRRMRSLQGESDGADEREPCADACILIKALLDLLPLSRGGPRSEHANL